MAISPNSFFSLTNPNSSISNSRRDYFDMQLNFNIQSLTSLISNLVSQLSGFSKSILFGQKQENEILNSSIAAIARQQQLFSSGLVEDEKDISNIAIPSTSPTVGTGVKSFFAGGMAAGGLATVIQNILNQSNDNNNPGPSSPVTGPAPPEIKALMETISGPESGGNYEAMYPNTTLPGATGMTIAQVSRTATGAVGRYQNMPNFLQERAKLAKLDFNRDLYSPENQDKMTRAHLASLLGGEQKAVQALRKDPVSVSRRLNRTWTSMPGGSEEKLNDEQVLQQYQINLKKYQPTGSTQSKSKSNKVSSITPKSSDSSSEQTKIASVGSVSPSESVNRITSTNLITSSDSDTQVSIVPIPMSQNVKQTSRPQVRNQTSFTASPNSGHWISEIQRLHMGIVDV